MDTRHRSFRKTSAMSPHLQPLILPELPTYQNVLPFLILKIYLNMSKEFLSHITSMCNFGLTLQFVVNYVALKILFLVMRKIIQFTNYRVRTAIKYTQVKLNSDWVLEQLNTKRHSEQAKLNIVELSNTLLKKITI